MSVVISLGANPFFVGEKKQLEMWHRQISSLLNALLNGAIFKPFEILLRKAYLQNWIFPTTVFVFLFSQITLLFSHFKVPGLNMSICIQRCTD